MAIMLPCLNCGTLTEKSYCPQHTPAWQTQRPDRPNRPSSHQRGYNSVYKKNRATLLADNPPCNHCKKHGTPSNPITADHIISLHQGGTNDLDNLQPLCRQCNSRKK